MSRVNIDNPEELYQESHLDEQISEQISEEEQQQNAVALDDTLFMRDEQETDLVDYYGNRYTKKDIMLKRTGKLIDDYLTKNYGEKVLRERIRPATNEFTEVHHKRSRSIVREGGGDEIVEFMLAGSGFKEFRKEHKGIHGKGKSKAANDYTQYESVMEEIRKSGLEETFNPQKWGKLARFKSFMGCIFKGFDFKKHDEKNRIKKIYEEARKQKEIDDLNREVGTAVKIGDVTHKHVRLKTKELANGAHLHRYNIAGSTSVLGGMFNRGSHSIENNVEYIKVLGEERLKNWIEEYRQGNEKPIRFLFRGHSRGGDACVTGAMMIKKAALELSKDDEQLREALLKNLKFEIIQHEPVAGLGSNSGVNEEVNYKLQTKEMQKRNLPALGDNLVESTIFYSMHSNRNIGFTPQKVFGAKRVILTPANHSVGINRIQKGAYKEGHQDEQEEIRSQVFTDAKTRIKYRGAGISELPEGLYIQKENGELVKMESVKEALDIYREALKENRVSEKQEERHDVIEEVIQAYFFKDYDNVVDMLDRKKVDGLVGFSKKEKEALTDGTHAQQHELLDGIVKELMRINFKPSQLDDLNSAFEEYGQNKAFWLKAAQIYNLYINKDRVVSQYIDALPDEALEKFMQVQGYVDNMLRMIIKAGPEVKGELKAQGSIDLEKVRPKANTRFTSTEVLKRYVKRHNIQGYDEMLEHYGDEDKWDDVQDVGALKELLKSVEGVIDKTTYDEVFDGRDAALELYEGYRQTESFPFERDNKNHDILHLFSSKHKQEFMGYVVWRISKADDPVEKERLMKAYKYIQISRGLSWSKYSTLDVFDDPFVATGKEPLIRGQAETLSSLVAAKEYFKTPENMQDFLVRLSGTSDEYREYNPQSGETKLKIFYGPDELEEAPKQEEREREERMEESFEEEILEQPKQVQKETEEKQKKEYERKLLLRKKEALLELMYVSKLSYNELEKMVGLEKISIDNLALYGPKFNELDCLGQVWTEYFTNPYFIDRDSKEDTRFYYQMMYIHNIATVGMYLNRTVLSQGAEEKVLSEAGVREQFGKFLDEMEEARAYLSTHKMIEPAKYERPDGV